ncbi:hypothetical protein niasHT_033606 [Heterodera trifolii]|uniref:Uncharacterized protein n=1 Tax=Heterodera trifolii TaxID=157864 RepID=A0ABD2I8C9_9BILA
MNHSHPQANWLVERFYSETFANFLHLEEQPMAHNRLRPIKEGNKKISNDLNRLNTIIGFGFEQLRSVDLNNDLINLCAGSFWDSVHFERIVLSKNNLRTIWRNTFCDKNILLDLDLSRNNFTAALASSRASLTVLKMFKNVIKVLNRRDFEGRRNLNVLELVENCIETQELESLSLSQMSAHSRLPDTSEFAHLQDNSHLSDKVNGKTEGNPDTAPTKQRQKGVKGSRCCRRANDGIANRRTRRRTTPAQLRGRDKCCNGRGDGQSPVSERRESV